MSQAPSLETLFDRPVIILAAPRSGSTLLFETLATAESLWTVGGESHLLIEGLPPLTPASGAVDSNRLTARHATPEIIRALRIRFAQNLRDASGRPWMQRQVSPVRLLEKTPKNALRLPFLDAVFPGAHFVVLVRDPRPNIASMIEAWRSGRWVTYPRMPGWEGPPWSLLLPPGWPEWNGLAVEAICARQWAVTHEILLDDLAALDRDRWTAVRYEQLVDDAEAVVRRIADRAGVAVTGALAQRIRGELPLSRYTQTRPDPDKWRRHEAAIAAEEGTFMPIQQRIERELFPNGA